jgi:hypothetical protein
LTMTDFAGALSLLLSIAFDHRSGGERQWATRRQRSGSSGLPVLCCWFEIRSDIFV